jgi:hypothetical protein
VTTLGNQVIVAVFSRSDTRSAKAETSNRAGLTSLVSQLLYRLRAVAETENPYPRGACLPTHNLWEIAAFCTYFATAEYCKKQMPALVADVR